MAGHVFFSHSDKNRRAADELVRLLETKGLEIWIAPRDVRPGKNYVKETEQAIEDCGALAVLITEESNVSDFVHSETGMAFDGCTRLGWTWPHDLERRRRRSRRHAAPPAGEARFVM